MKGKNKENYLNNLIFADYSVPAMWSGDELLQMICKLNNHRQPKTGYVQEMKKKLRNIILRWDNIIKSIINSIGDLIYEK